MLMFSMSCVVPSERANRQSPTRECTLTGKKVMLCFKTLSALSAVILSAVVYFETRSVDVGVRVSPCHVSCVWRDAKGCERPAVSTAPGRFIVPKGAKSFRFVFPASAEPYAFQGLTVFGVPAPSAAWLIENAATTLPVYDEFYLPRGMSARIPAPREVSFECRSLFPMMMRLIPSAGAALALLLLIAAVLSVTGIRWPKQPVWLNAMMRSRSALAVAAVAVSLLTLPKPVNAAAPGLDPSYHWLFNAIVGMGEHWSGSRFVFTYGPLGFLLFPQSANVVPALLVNLLYAALWVAAILRMARGGAYLPALWSVVAAAALFPVPREWGWPLLALMLMMCRGGAFVAGAVCAFAAMLKLTSGAACAATAVMAVVCAAMTRSEKPSRMALALVAGALAVFLPAVPLLFGSWESVSVWVSRSLEIMAGYNSAMVWPASVPETLAPALCAAALCLYLAVPGIRMRSTWGLLLFLPLLAVTYKYGVTRGGFMSARVMLYAMPALAALAAAYAEPSLRSRALKACAALCVIALAATMPSSLLPGAGSPFGVNPRAFWETLTLPSAVARAESLGKENLKPAILADEWIHEIKEAGGFQPFPHDLSSVAANGLLDLYVPVLTFQAYVAYTASLDRWCAELYTSAHAPGTMLVTWEPVDRRNPVLDTPAVWREILQNYKVSRVEGGNVLLRRCVGAKSAEYGPAEETSVSPGEWFRLPDRGSLMSVRWGHSAQGRLMSLVFHDTISSVSIRYSDGREVRYRVIPEVLVTPFRCDLIPRAANEMLEMLENPSRGPAAYPVGMMFDCGAEICREPFIKIGFYGKRGG